MLNNNIYEKLNKAKEKKPKKSESLTAKMAFDVDSVSDNKDILTEMPKLKEFSSFKGYSGSMGGGMNRNRVIKYIVLMYSHDTVLNQRPPLELNDRKLRAAEIAGFEREKSGKFRKIIVDQLFHLITPKKDDDESDVKKIKYSHSILDMVFEYLKAQKSHIWTEICTQEQELDEYIRLRLQPVSDDKDKDTLIALEKKDKLRASCKAMLKDLANYYKDFFADHDDVAESVKEEKKYYTMETLAKDA